MLVIDKMERAQLTDVERVVADYLVAHREEIGSLTARGIGDAVHCSPSAVIRLAQKLGFGGFNELRQQMEVENPYLDAGFGDVDANIPFAAGDSPMSVARKVAELAHEAEQDTLALLSHDLLRDAANLVARAEQVYVFAYSASAAQAEVFRAKMARIGRRVTVCSQMGESNYYLRLARPTDAVVVISYSGETKRLLKVASLARERDVPVLAITSVGENGLSRLGSCVLRLSTRERLLEKIANYASEHSLALLLDVLYSCVFRIDYDRNLEEKVTYARRVEAAHVSGNRVING